MGFKIKNGVLKKYTEEPGVTEVVIPDCVTSIGVCAFWGCINLANITIPDGVKSIGDCVFDGCSSLTSITIPDGVRRIGKSAFYYCGSLTSITIPDSVTSIGDYAFWDCNKLKKIASDVSVLPDANMKQIAALTYCSMASAFTDKQAASCQKYLFSQKKKLMPMILKDDAVSALSIFANAGKITKDNVDEVFLNPAIKAEAMQCIAFLMDWKNENVSAEDEEKRFIREIEKDPYNITDMKKLWFYEKTEDGTVCLTGYKGNEINVVIPERIGSDKVTALGDGLFDIEKSGRLKQHKDVAKKIKTVIIPDTVVSIGVRAFYGCESLTSIEIPDNVKRIEEKHLWAATVSQILRFRTA